MLHDYDIELHACNIKDNMVLHKVHLCKHLEKGGKLTNIQDNAATLGQSDKRQYSANYYTVLVNSAKEME